VFDVSFVELMVIGVVALLVLGPERLPGAARTVGSFVRKARQGWAGVRTEFERQLAVDEVRRSAREVKDSIEGSAAPRPAAANPAAAPAAAAPGTPAPGSAPVPEHAPHD
jgi:sec-independent protein translocase protein TatB